MPFSLERMKATGEPFLVMGDAGSPSIAADGSLAFRQGSAGVEARVVRLNASGAVLDTLTDSQFSNFSLALSPDERMLMVESRSGGEGDLWLHDLERGGRTRFAHASGRQSSPAWSPDGNMVYFNDGADRVWVKPADGSQPPRLLCHGFQPRVTADGRHLIYCKPVESGVDLWYSTIATGDSFPLVQSPSLETLPMPSPRGGHLLYVSNETGQNEVYLGEFPSGRGRWQVSTQGGSKAMWSHRGDRILYWSGEHLYEVAIELEPNVRMGPPRKLLDLRALRIPSVGRFTVLPTSRPQEFLAIQTTGNQGAHTHVVLVENWLAEYRTGFSGSAPRGGR
jgi:Tol biopolymer transport system component